MNKSVLTVSFFLVLVNIILILVPLNRLTAKLMLFYQNIKIITVPTFWTKLNIQTVLIFSQACFSFLLLFVNEKKYCSRYF